MNRGKVNAIIAVVLVALVLFGVTYASWGFISDVFQPITINQPTMIIIQPGEDVQGLADDFYQKGLIKNKLAFRIWAKLKGLDAKLQVGAYRLTPDMSMDRVTAKLESGQPDSKALRIIEGYRLEEIANAIDKLGLPNFNKQEFLHYVQHPDSYPNSASYPILQGVSSMEGLLFPDTYAVPINYNARQVIGMMLDQFTHIETQYNLVAQAKQHQLSEYQMVILASIVQREVRYDDDLGNVASVYWNRIEKPNDETVGKLDSDPTVQYARDTDTPPDRYWSPLNDIGSQVDPSSPWNTYKKAGWPPTPIASPGLKALQAAANPPATRYYFFLSDKEGHNHYAETATQFEQLKARYLG